MEQLYFSDEIQRKLSGIYRSGLTMIEAPAGYGKSTAVRWAMKKLPADQVRWFTAVSFQQDTSLDWFIRQIGSLDASAGNALRELGFLNRSNVSDAATTGRCPFCRLWLTATRMGCTSCSSRRTSKSCGLFSRAPPA